METPGLGYMDLLRMLTGPVYSQSAALPHKQAYCSIAKCVAALTRACPTEGPAVVGQFIQVRSPVRLPVCEAQIKVCLITRAVFFFILPSVPAGREEQPLHRLHPAAHSALIGRGGTSRDLSSQPELKTVILDAFSSSSEEVTPVCVFQRAFHLFQPYKTYRCLLSLRLLSPFGSF